MNDVERRRLNQLQRAYVEDLHARTISVRCPHCRAKPGEWCIGAYGRTKGCHVSRKDEAKRVGKVKGGWWP